MSDVKVNEFTILASIVKDSFYEFLKEFWTVIVAEEPVLNWHVEYLCDELQVMAERVFLGEPKAYDLVINVPPGSTKSTIVSQAFPAWVWTRLPSAKFVCASYAQAVAMKDSLKARDLVQSDKYQSCFPNIQLREDENTKGLFTNTQMGSRLCVGVGGAITGYHGHFQLVDDPINPEESYSQVEIKRINRWMTTTLPTRKVDKLVSPLILVQQRLGQADPSGELLARKAGQIKHICLPGELHKSISPPGLKKYYVDGLLDPVRMPREVLETLKEELGAYGYASQVLQDPVPLGGGMFETDKVVYEDNEPKLLRMVRSWDKAGTPDGGNWSAGVRIGVDKKGKFWICDVRRGQWGATKREERIAETAEEDGDEVPVVIEIEGGSGGKESGESTVRNLAGFKVIAFHPTGDKEARAYPLASQMGAGNVYCLKRAWTKDFIDELKYFPHGKYDDQVDAASGGFNKIAKKKKMAGAAW